MTMNTTTLDDAEQFCNDNDLELDLRTRSYGCAAYAVGNNSFIRNHPQSEKQKNLPWLSYEIRLGGFRQSVDQAWEILYPKPYQIPDDELSRSAENDTW